MNSILPMVIVIASLPLVGVLLVAFVSPPLLGYLLRTLAATLTDPVVIIGIFVAVVLCLNNFSGYWALIVGLATSAIHIAMGYSWWVKVAGRQVALATAWKAAFIDTGIVAYAFLITWIIYEVRNKGRGGKIAH